MEPLEYLRIISSPVQSNDIRAGSEHWQVEQRVHTTLIGLMQLTSFTRRRFLSGTIRTGALLGIGQTSGLVSLSPVTAAETKVSPSQVQFSTDTESIVRLLAETPQEGATEMMVGLLRSGVPYRKLLAGLFLVALQTRLEHNVYVVHSAHQLALDAPPGEQLLPIFWALANFKHWQKYHSRKAIAFAALKGTLPSSDKALADFRAGMDNVDEEKASRAIIALARNEGAHQVFDALWPYAALNCQTIYHSAVGLANLWRALETIGWQHAEQMLRGRVHMMLAGSTAPLLQRGDWTYVENRERARRSFAKLPPQWAGDKSDPGLTRELLGLIREFKANEAADLALGRLLAGKAQASAIWDAVHLAAGELLMKKPHVTYPVHSNTGANAIHYGFRASSNPEVRLLLLLQGIGWQCHARKRVGELAASDATWKQKELRIDEVNPGKMAEAPETAVAEIFLSLGSQPDESARRAFAVAQKHPDLELFQQAARQLLFRKVLAPDTHDIKYPVAVFEDFHWVSAEWRPHLVASSVSWLPGADKPDSPVWQEAREAVKRI